MWSQQYKTQKLANIAHSSKQHFGFTCQRWIKEGSTGKSCIFSIQLEPRQKKKFLSWALLLNYWQPTRKAKKKNFAEHRTAGLTSCELKNIEMLVCENWKLNVSGVSTAMKPLAALAPAECKHPTSRCLLLISGVPPLICSLALLEITSNNWAVVR